MGVDDQSKTSCAELPGMTPPVLATPQTLGVRTCRPRVSSPRIVLQVADSLKYPELQVCGLFSYYADSRHSLACEFWLAE